MNEAALLAAREGKREITQLELEEGIMRVIAGPEKKTRVMSEKERLVTAYHEMGHAMVAHFLDNTDPVHKISIISRGQALGYTISLPTEDKFLTTRAELADTLAMTLGGRAAEEITFCEITTGAANDLEKVTADREADGDALRHVREARAAHVRPRPVAAVPRARVLRDQQDYCDEIAREIDDEIRRIVEEAHQTAKAGPERPPRRPRPALEGAARARDDRARGIRAALLAGKTAEEVFGPPEPPSRSLRAAGRARAQAGRRAAPAPAAAAARPRRRHGRDARPISPSRPEL